MEAAECSQCGQTVLVWNDRVLEHDIETTEEYGARCGGSGWLVATHDWYRRKVAP